jgi:hypothetical protein
MEVIVELRFGAMRVRLAESGKRLFGSSLHGEHPPAHVPDAWVTAIERQGAVRKLVRLAQQRIAVGTGVKAGDV